ncbi:GntP family permease [candidate division KSB1 bacterium]|nr:GntP family permease [candidate division KSB1 bacterium]
MGTLIVFLAAVVFIIVMTGKVKMNAFLVLILAAYGVGIFSGIGLDTTLAAIRDGFGGTIGYIGIVITLGAVIGTLLEKSGAAFTLANTILRWVGQARAALAMALTGYVVSIPVFCDSGFVILSPLSRALAEKAKISLATMSIALSMGLYVTHCLVPPTPGPIAAAGTLGADLGTVIVLGLVASIPGLVAGYFFATRFASRFQIDPNPGVGLDEIQARAGSLPSATKSFAPLVVPILLIGLKSIAEFPGHIFGDANLKSAIVFVGNPNTALIIGVFLALFTVPRLNRIVLQDWIGEGVKNAGWIILITGAGGALGAVLKATPLIETIGQNLSALELGIFLPFLIAAALKTGQGSSTVAIITTSSLLAPLLPVLGLDGATARALVVLSIGAGAMTVSHANDSYFWVVSQFSDMENIGTAYRTQTLGTLVVGVSTILGVWFLSLLLI